MKRKLTGSVVSTNMQKTVVVEVPLWRQHGKYHKLYRVARRFKAHDANSACRVGDQVLIEETRPISKEKRWRVVEKIERIEDRGSRVPSENEKESTLNPKP